MAKREELDLLSAFGAVHEDDELEQMAGGAEEERQPRVGFVPVRLARSGGGPEEPLLGKFLINRVIDYSGGTSVPAIG